METGRTLLHYRLAEKIGAGGMGEVWRAADTTLGRDVAIKILPAEFAADAERLARFDREARVLASLNHPNIAAIYGFHEADGIRFLAMELVPGEGLDDRIGRGALPVGEARAIALKIAEALEYAHERGIVHRDLKPANVRIAPDGVVKVLDFGLAKAVAGEISGSGPTSTPTIIPTMTSAGTAAGLILGTAAYMSPEQARGKPVDRRADIWAFGVVLAEMLKGQRLFEGETVSDTLAAVLTRPLDLDGFAFSGLLKRCLERDPRLRLRDIGEARIALERSDAPEPAGARPAAPAKRPWPLVAALVLVSIAAIAGWLRRPATNDVPERRAEIAFPAGAHANPNSVPAPSPDGRYLAIDAVDDAGTPHLYLRSIDSFEYRPLKGTEGALFAFWSPDSKWLGFIARGGMRRLQVPDGVVETILAQGVGPRGASWGPDGTILYSPDANSALWRVPVSGGKPEPVTKLDPAIVDGSHRFPIWLPDGEHFLYILWSNNSKAMAESGGAYVASIPGGASKRVSQEAGSFVFVAPDRLLFHREGHLLAVPFDTKTFAVGPQAIVAPDVRFSLSSGLVQAGASRTGDIVFLGPERQPMPRLAWLDRKGGPTEIMSLPGRVGGVRLSPDGSRFAAETEDAYGLTEISVGEFQRGTLTRMTRSENDSYSPVWSPDGTRLAFCNRDSGTEDIYLQIASGTRPKELLWEAKPVDTNLAAWSVDGRYLIFEGKPRAGAAQVQIWIYDVHDGAARALIAEDYNVSAPALSADGRWLAYASDESGRREVYVRSFPDLERKWQVSKDGGGAPHWRRDGKELVFAGGANEQSGLWAVSTEQSASGITIGSPTLLFANRAEIQSLEPSADHSRFLAVLQAAAYDEPPMRLIQAWRK